MSDALIVDGGAASVVAMGNGEGVANSDTDNKVVYRKPRNQVAGRVGAKERFTNPNGVFSRPKSEYISPCELSHVHVCMYVIGMPAGSPPPPKLYIGLAVENYTF